MNNNKKRVLILCTHNSVRSQMGEGLFNSLYGNRFEVFSAGSKPSGVNPLAIKVLSEIGIDISKNRSKNATEFLGQAFDYVITVCDNARDTCPFFPGAKQYIHKAFFDPGTVEGSEEEKLNAFRRSRDEISLWIKDTFK